MNLLEHQAQSGNPRVRAMAAEALKLGRRAPGLGLTASEIYSGSSGAVAAPTAAPAADQFYGAGAPPAASAAYKQNLAAPGSLEAALAAASGAAAPAPVSTWGDWISAASPWLVAGGTLAAFTWGIYRLATRKPAPAAQKVGA